MSWSKETSRELVAEMMTFLFDPESEYGLQLLAEQAYQASFHRRHKVDKAQIEHLYNKAEASFLTKIEKSVATINQISTLVAGPIPAVLLTLRKGLVFHNFKEFEQKLEEKAGGRQKLKNALVYAPLNAWLGDPAENVEFGQSHDIHYEGFFQVKQTQPLSPVTSLKTGSIKSNLDGGAPDESAITPISEHQLRQIRLDRETKESIWKVRMERDVQLFNERMLAQHKRSSVAATQHYTKLIRIISSNATGKARDYYLEYWQKRRDLLLEIRNQPPIEVRLVRSSVLRKNPRQQNFQPKRLFTRSTRYKDKYTS